MQAVSDGADVILNCCSSVGEVADAAQNIGRYTGIPIVRIDEEMCREAVRLGKRVGVLATLPTTLEPTKNTVSRVAREMNSHVELVDGLVDAFGADQNKFKALLCAKAEEIADRVDVILLARDLWHMQKMQFMRKSVSRYFPALASGARGTCRKHCRKKGM